MFYGILTVLVIINVVSLHFDIFFQDGLIFSPIVGKLSPRPNFMAKHRSTRGKLLFWVLCTPDFRNFKDFSTDFMNCRDF